MTKERSLCRPGGRSKVGMMQERGRCLDSGQPSPEVGKKPLFNPRTDRIQPSATNVLRHDVRIERYAIHKL